MAQRRSKTPEDAYEALFAALAHAARRRALITIYFHNGAMTAGQIAAVFEHAWQTTTRHLRVLEAAGLLAHEKRGRERIYRIQPKRLELARDWLAYFSRNPNPRKDKHPCQLKIKIKRRNKKRLRARTVKTFRDSSGSTSKSAI